MPMGLTEGRAQGLSVLGRMHGLSHRQGNCASDLVAAYSLAVMNEYPLALHGLLTRLKDVESSFQLYHCAGPLGIRSVLVMLAELCSNSEELWRPNSSMYLQLGQILRIFIVHFGRILLVLAELFLCVEVGFPSSLLVITWRSPNLAIFENGWPGSIRDPLLATRPISISDSFCFCAGCWVVQGKVLQRRGKKVKHGKTMRNHLTIGRPFSHFPIYWHSECPDPCENGGLCSSWNHWPRTDSFLLLTLIDAWIDSLPIYWRAPKCDIQWGVILVLEASLERMISLNWWSERRKPVDDGWTFCPLLTQLEVVIMLPLNRFDNGWTIFY